MLVLVRYCNFRLLTRWQDLEPAASWRQNCTRWRRLARVNMVIVRSYRKD